MAMDWQMMPVRLDVGMDGKADPRALQGKLLSLQNGMLTAPGAIKKRPGYARLPSPGTTGRGVFALDNELVAHVDTYLHSRDTPASRWINKGQAPACSVETIGVGDTAANTYSTSGDVNGALVCDVAYANGHTAVIWTDGSNPYVSIFNSAGVLVLMSSDLGTVNAANLAYPRAVAAGNYLFFVWLDGNNIMYAYYDTGGAPPSMSASAVLVAVGAAAEFDVAPYNATTFRLVYHNGVNLSVSSCFTGGVTAGPTNTAHGGFAGGLSICVTASLATFAFWRTGAGPVDLRGAAWDSARAVLVAPGNVEAGGFGSIWGTTVCAESTTANKVDVFYDTGDLVNLDACYVRKASLTTAGVITAGAPFAFTSLIATRPFKYTTNSRSYIGLRHQSRYVGATKATRETTVVFVETVDSTKILATALVYEADTTARDQTQQASSAVSVGGNSFVVAIPKQVEILGSQGSIRATATLTTLNLAANPTYARRDGSVHIATAYVSQYDQAQVVEHSYLNGPDLRSVTSLIAGGGALVPGNVHSVIAVYTWTDAEGRRHVSRPSQAVSVTIAGGDNACQAVTRCLHMTRRAGVSIGYYRTTNGGTVYYWDGETAASAAPPTADSVTKDLLTADASLTSAAALYTTGGVLENRTPPSPRSIFVAKDRLWVPNGAELHHTKKFVGGVAAAWGIGLSKRLTQVRKPLAVVAMDDKVVVMGEDALAYFVGDGPSDLGQGAWSEDYRIESPVACASAASVVQIPAGVMFQAANSAGIWLLTRGLDLQYIGADVDGYNAYTVTSAVLVPKRNQVKITLSDGSNGPQVLLVYDLLSGQWGFESIAGGNRAIGGVLWRGEHAYMLSNGDVYYQDATLFADNAVGYQLRFRTGWLKPAGMQGYWRARRIAIVGAKKAAHNLVCEVRYDYDETIAETFTFDASDNVPAGDDNYQFRARLERQKCEALSVEIYDHQTEYGANEGFSINELAIEVGMKRGINRLGSTKTVLGA